MTKNIFDFWIFSDFELYLLNVKVETLQGLC